MLPPLIKTFTWHLIRRALATGSQASRFSQHIDENCTRCGNLETDAHLFFHCDFARTVWFSATPALCTANLPPEDDCVQTILQLVISAHVNDYLLQKILTVDSFGKQGMITVLQGKHGLTGRYTMLLQLTFLLIISTPIKQMNKTNYKDTASLMFSHRILNLSTLLWGSQGNLYKADQVWLPSLQGQVPLLTGYSTVGTIPQWRWSLQSTWVEDQAFHPTILQPVTKQKSTHLQDQ